MKGLGIDTLSVDRGISKKLEVHHILNSADMYAIENLNDRLRELPPRTTFVFAMSLKIGGGSGAPARVIAFVPK